MEKYEIPAVIMAGGFRRRTSSIDSSIPKPLIPIGGKPVLEWEIECLVNQGYTNIILTVSYMADKIQDFFGDGSRFGCVITYYYEDTPLGNAGALFKLWANRKLDGDFLLLNADSMFDVDLDRFVAFHQSRCNEGIIVTLFVHPNSHPYDSGLIVTDTDNIVTEWLTKEDDRPVYYKNSVNAGLHILNTKALEMVDVDVDKIGTVDNTGKLIKVDLDRQVLKPLVNTGKIVAYHSPEYVKDMGTLERFQQVSTDLISEIVSTRNLKKRQKAIFLDRDGTINKYFGFLRGIDDFELIPGVADAIKLINESGYLAIVVTNQPVIARGEVTEEELQNIHNKMETLLGERGAYVDAVYYCPHHPDKGFYGEVAELKIDCDCRKPKPGMLFRAADDYNIDLSQSWMVGDSERDIQTGKNAGCNTVLLYGDETEVAERGNYSDSQSIQAKKMANNLLNAVRMILL